jgi:signal peptidase I
VAVLCIRSFCLGSYRISTSAMENTLHRGDYVLVNKLPLKLKRNQVLLFTSPLIKDRGNAPLLVSRCIALPGDTVQVNASGYSVNGAFYPRSPNVLSSYLLEQETKSAFLQTLKDLNIPLRDLKEGNAAFSVSLTPFEEYRIREELTEQMNSRFIRRESGGYRFVVPRKGQTCRLDASFLTACREAILSETGGQAEFRDEKLFLNGKEADRFRFSRDYYWLLSDNINEAVDSRHLGFIPAGHIVGNAWFCWYSRDKERAFKKIN